MGRSVRELAHDYGHDACWQRMDSGRALSALSAAGLLLLLASAAASLAGSAVVSMADVLAASSTPSADFFSSSI